MSDDFDGLDAMEKAGIGATLNRCRFLVKLMAAPRHEVWATAVKRVGLFTALR